MKNLILIRHAKSVIDQFGVCDFERIISTEGFQETTKLVNRYINEFPKPDLIISSSSTRTKETVAILENRISDSPEIKYTDKLYLASPDKIDLIISDIEDSIQTLAIVSHNPGLTSYFNRFSSEDNMPPSGIALFKLEIFEWTEIFTATGNLSHYIYPE